MIPLRDTNPSSKFPYVTILLITANVVLFLFEMSLGSKINQFISIFGMVPNRYFYLTEHNWFHFPARFYPFITSIFVHGGWFHIIGNMWFLWIFGDNVEDRLGHIRFLILYLIFGLIAGFVHAYIYPNSTIPTVGASGAVAGVMGAYFIYYPKAKILTLIPIFIFLHFMEIPAYIFLGIWFLFQFFSGAINLANSSSACCGIAWWAHIGGFVAGILTAIIFYKRSRRNKRRIISINS